MERFVNGTSEVETFNLDTKYCDVDGNTVEGILTLDPFSSKLLIRCYCNFDDYCYFKETSATCAQDCGAPPVNQNPVARAGSDQTVFVDDIVDFNGSASYDPDGSIVSYHWDFDDGQTSSQVNPWHSYQASSTYSVVLTVTDNDGATDTDTCIITVLDESAATEMYVSEIRMSLRRDRTRYYAVAEVLVVDINGMPVAGATVNGHWSGVTNEPETFTTQANGWGEGRSRSVRNRTGFVFTVDDITKQGYLYNSALNQETSDSI